MVRIVLLYKHLNLNSEQNGLNIELDAWNLANKPNPIGTASKWQKKSKIFYFYVSLGKKNPAEMGFLGLFWSILM